MALNSYSIPFTKEIEEKITKHRTELLMGAEDYGKDILGFTKDIIYVWKRRGKISFRCARRLKELGIL